jgi:hypothetical protein
MFNTPINLALYRLLRESSSVESQGTDQHVSDLNLVTDRIIEEIKEKEQVRKEMALLNKADDLGDLEKTRQAIFNHLDQVFNLKVEACDIEKNYNEYFVVNVEKELSALLLYLSESIKFNSPSDPVGLTLDLVLGERINGFKDDESLIYDDEWLEVDTTVSNRKHGDTVPEFNAVEFMNKRKAEVESQKNSLKSLALPIPNLIHYISDLEPTSPIVLLNDFSDFAESVMDTYPEIKSDLMALSLNLKSLAELVQESKSSDQPGWMETIIQNKMEEIYDNLITLLDFFSEYYNVSDSGQESDQAFVVPISTLTTRILRSLEQLISPLH